MGTLKIMKEEYHRNTIVNALDKRNMEPDQTEEWEIHGPHYPEMPYQVYGGYAVSRDDEADTPLVAIYPRAIYEIEDRADWGRVRSAVPRQRGDELRQQFTEQEFDR